MGEALQLLTNACSLRLAGIWGGSKDNAITRSAYALFVAPAAEESRIQSVTAAYERELRELYAAADPDLHMVCRPDNTGVAEVWDQESSERIIRLLNEVPNGVQAMSRDIEGLVETSLNLGIVKVTGDTLELTFSVRSSVGRDKEYLTAVLRSIAERYGAVYFQKGDYPAGEYRKDEEQYGEKPQVIAIHAGLECGLLAGKLPGLDSVSFGPNLTEIHTTRESMSIASVARTWRYLLTVLERL